MYETKSMKKINIPPKTVGDFSLPILGLGTWRMGGGYERDPKNDDRRDIEAIQEAIKLGYTHLDTAELYAAGHAEELVREAIMNFDRDTLFITSKVMPEHLRYGDLIRSAHGSLKRLAIEKFDLYLIHAPNHFIPLKETMAAMDYLLENNLTRYIGVSNFDVSHLEEAQSFSRYKIVNNQIHYSLVARAYEKNGTLEYCRKHEILVTSYRPLEKGELANPGHAVLDRISAKYHKTPAQVAINWLISKPNIVTLVKSSNPKHLKANLEALGWSLSSEDEALLDQGFRKDQTIYGPMI